MAEIRNKENVLGDTEKNTDGSPVQERRDDDGDKVSEIRNKENILGDTETNSDGSPVKVETPSK